MEDIKKNVSTFFQQNNMRILRTKKENSENKICWQLSQEKNQSGSRGVNRRENNSPINTFRNEFFQIICSDTDISWHLSDSFISINFNLWTEQKTR